MYMQVARIHSWKNTQRLKPKNVTGLPPVEIKHFLSTST